MAEAFESTATHTHRASHTPRPASHAESTGNVNALSRALHAPYGVLLLTRRLSYGRDEPLVICGALRYTTLPPTPSPRNLDTCHSGPPDFLGDLFALLHLAFLPGPHRDRLHFPSLSSFKHFALPFLSLFFALFFTLSLRAPLPPSSLLGSATPFCLALQLTSSRPPPHRSLRLSRLAPLRCSPLTCPSSISYVLHRLFCPHPPPLALDHLHLMRAYGLTCYFISFFHNILRDSLLFHVNS